MRKCADSEARAREREREKRLTLKRKKKRHRSCNRNIFHEYVARNTIKKRLVFASWNVFLFFGVLKDNAIKKGNVAVERFRRDVYASQKLVIIARVRKERKEGETPKRARCDNEPRFPRKFKRCGDTEDSFVIRRCSQHARRSVPISFLFSISARFSTRVRGGGLLAICVCKKNGRQKSRADYAET